MVLINAWWGWQIGRWCLHLHSLWAASRFVLAQRICFLCHANHSRENLCHLLWLGTWSTDMLLMVLLVNIFILVVLLKTMPWILILVQYPSSSIAYWLLVCSIAYQWWHKCFGNFAYQYSKPGEDMDFTDLQRIRPHFLVESSRLIEVLAVS